MEVHHHPEVKKKKFKEYIQEGLMIFLAVFMGFIAENIREHIADTTKEKEYVKSLLHDLQQDSARIADVTVASNRLITGQDSLLNLLADSAGAPRFNDKAYNLFFKYGTSLAVFNSTDRAITQLTSSGNFRLIGDQRVADSISNYYDKVKDAGVQANLNNVASNDCFSYAQNLFKFRYGLHPQTANKQLITQNQATITSYVNKLTQMRISQQYYVQVDLKSVGKSCTSLIKFLKADYDISQ